MWWDEDWDDAVRRLFPAVVRRLVARHLAEADAQDACQEAWLELFRKPCALRDRDRLEAWLCTTARRCSARMIARRAREAVALPRSPEPSPETRVVIAERDQKLWSVVADLPERSRRLLYLLAHRPELSIAQVAADLGVSPASVATLRRRCCERVRRRLQAEGVHRG
ncbi:RNA polymerase sigma factor [Amycolatopsis sp. NPDC059027]|uniref:RNA polymerase sigma factor n=1 Tax=unclassified Amycolatopsis TaxID=2618356 RepID=UPI00366BA756